MSVRNFRHRGDWYRAFAVLWIGFAIVVGIRWTSTYDSSSDVENELAALLRAPVRPVSAAVAAPGLSLRKAAPSPAVYPLQSIPLKFSHQVHVSRGIGCEHCHAGIASSQRASDLNLPSGETCDQCHGPQHPRAEKTQPRCGSCHELSAKGLVAQSVKMPAARLNFSHQRHADTPCERCHGDVAKVDLATREQLPLESTCLSCHDGKKARNDCQSCHPREPDGRLQTSSVREAELASLVPKSSVRGAMTHDLRFVFDHGAVAAAQRDRCASCHQESFCTDCHAGSVRPLQLHPGGFLGSHAEFARSSTQNCMSCHQVGTDCRACHLRLGISDTVSMGSASPTSLKFHPPGWAALDPGMGQGHAAAARRNLTSCVSCHSEDTCLSCHATATVGQPGFNVSPHGSGFRSSGRCQALASRNRRVCLKCHAPGQPELECDGASMR